MKKLLVAASILFVSATMLLAEKVEKKGSFGIVYNESFIKFSYVITYLGTEYKDNQIAFRIDFEDTKGFDLSSEFDPNGTFLKNRSNKKIAGTIERKSASSVVLLFPDNGEFSMKGKTRLYATIMGYKLKKNFKI